MGATNTWLPAAGAGPSTRSSAMWNLACSPILARGDEAAFGIFVVGGLIALTAILSHHWRRHREIAYNARLKQLMIERGMTADEIERVVQATPNEMGRAARRFRDRMSL
jgi:hypothetical protein